MRILDSSNVNMKISYSSLPHTIGLRHLEEDDNTYLVWGQIDSVSPGVVDIHLTIYGCDPGACRGVRSKEHLQWAARLFARNLGAGYTVRHWNGYPPKWEQDFAKLPRDELNTIFCQLISTVVHEMPLVRDFRGLPHPARPVWPPSLVEEKSEMLLQQLVTGELSLHKLLHGNGHIPQCIYLHG
jgi:hypothetical protein